MDFPSLDFSDKRVSFYYSSFVTTLDGKIMVKKDGYWPLGSITDFNYFTYLRSYADVIIDGKQTAIQFGERTIQRIHDEQFNTMRLQVGKIKKAEYIVITSSPDESLIQPLINQYGFKPFILTTEEAAISPELSSIAHIVKLSATKEGYVNLKSVDLFLRKENLRNIFIDGGAHLLGAFLQENLLDELFLTITPKIVGNELNKTVSLVEGILFSPDKVRQFELLSVEKEKDEVFLRYKIKRNTI